jgi:hypothetical protein
MPAVTQLTPNFLGGVSRQNDDKKLNGQLVECINGYPDPTYGLLKRTGMRFTNVLKKADGTAFTKAELEGAAWFYVERDAAGSYVGAIKGTNIYVWTAANGTWCTVTNTGTGYLTGTNQNDYHFRSVQDTTVITNKTVVTAMQPAGTFVPNTVGTVILSNLVATFDYSVTIQGVTFSVEAQNSSTFDHMLLFDAGHINTNHDLVDAIRAGILAQQAAANPDFAGVWYLEGYLNSLVIKRSTGTNSVKTDYSAVTGTPTSFTITAKGGSNNDALLAFQDQAENVTVLPSESFDGHSVKILNGAVADDDYHVEFEAYDGVKGRGFWKETVARDASPGLDATTMPHQLIRTGPTSFEFKPLPWKARITGDDVTSTIPAFIGFPITCTFFYSNRFGVLSQDNVFLGVANDPFNFFVKSALTQVGSDPIDLNVSSIRPVTLSDVLPSPQGLVIFSERQQFQIFTTDGSVLTPQSTIVRAISSYEMDTNIAPVDVGTTSAFVSRVSGYSKLFTLQLRDIEQNPTVVDISKVVLEWIPESIDDLTVSPQNSVIMLIDRGTSFLYLFRYYNNGEKDLFQAWTKWQLPGTIQSAKILNDSVVIVSQHEDEYTLGSITLDEIPTGDVVAASTSVEGNPCLDMFTRPFSPAVGVNPVVYDETNDITKIYVPFTPFQQREAVMLLTKPEADIGNTEALLESDAGYWAAATERTEPGTGYRYFEVKGNFTSYNDGVVVGYPYEFEATLPKFYFRRQENTTDFTATLTISRVKFSVGRTGAVTFKLRATGSNEWVNVQHVADADYYAADSNPVKPEHRFIVPIHQRNTNFELKVTSNFPYPVSLVSMMWEGNYSPRFYRRA